MTSLRSSITAGAAMPVNNFISSFSSLGRAEKKRNESLLNGLPLYLCFINQKNQNFAFFSFLSIDILTVIISAILILQFKEKKTFFLLIGLIGEWMAQERSEIDEINQFYFLSFSLWLPPGPPATAASLQSINWLGCALLIMGRSPAAKKERRELSLIY